MNAEQLWRDLPPRGQAVNSLPTQTCDVCGDAEIVRPGGRRFPPDLARDRLAARCARKGHECQPTYRAGWL